MKQINFDGLSVDEFRGLERSAWDGMLDFAEFPAAEYKFFDTVRTIGYRHRHEKYPMDFCKQDIEQARKVYEKEAEQLRYNLEANRAYQEAKRRSGELLNKIYKADDPAEKLDAALMCVELLTHEVGLRDRNLKYLEENRNDRV